ncbi:hypothetical protein BRO54_2433 [Geobacillus proteiniphilus]|uniref:Uncharacterized protein n=1 Tax=Geobacillus proteiniphilus TaxID=860353 RepID=A0A1Q5SWI1_9BACL|nr:hypothetical protein BRO54_2433 [Geobacillus proteiniphilus]
MGMRHRLPARAARHRRRRFQLFADLMLWGSFNVVRTGDENLVRLIFRSDGFPNAIGGRSIGYRLASSSAR